MPPSCKQNQNNINQTTINKFNKDFKKRLRQKITKKTKPFQLGLSSPHSAWSWAWGLSFSLLTPPHPSVQSRVWGGVMGQICYK